jgi:hypothetical protein
MGWRDAVAVMVEVGETNGVLPGVGNGAFIPEQLTKIRLKLTRVILTNP